MTAIYIASLLIILASSAGVCFMFYKNMLANTEHDAKIIAGLSEDNRDLRDRLFLRQNMPPVGTNIQEQYQARTEQTSANRDRTRPPVLGQREIQLQESFARKAREIEEQALRTAANGNN